MWSLVSAGIRVESNLWILQSTEVYSEYIFSFTKKLAQCDLFGNSCILSCLSLLLHIVATMWLFRKLNYIIQTAKITERN